MNRFLTLSFVKFPLQPDARWSQIYLQTLELSVGQRAAPWMAARPPRWTQPVTSRQLDDLLHRGSHRPQRWAATLKASLTQ